MIDDEVLAGTDMAVVLRGCCILVATGILASGFGTCDATIGR